MQINKHRAFTALKMTSLVLVILTLAISVAVGFKYVANKKSETEIAALENSINDLRSAIHVDSIRQYNIRKIITIMNDYNLVMPMHQKYEIAEEIYEMSKKYKNLNVDLICATITHESAGTWNPEIVSPAGAMGLMQIMPNTGMFVAAYEGMTWSSPEEVLFNPIYNIRIGASYLSSLIGAYDVDGGLAAYNGGEKRAALWLEKGKAYGILAKETQQYVPAVNRLYTEYQSMQI